MTTPYSLSNESGTWVAHALAFDVVAVNTNRESAISQLKVLLTAQIGFGHQQGYTLRQCYFGAPLEYWKPPFLEMELPSDEDLAEMKTWRRV